jgi:hypothetical protein
MQPAIELRDPAIASLHLMPDGEQLNGLQLWLGDRAGIALRLRT